MAPAGTLYVVATPLGNLDDITPRALEALARARIVACEDTRRTGRLLRHFGIRPPRVVSCHRFNERRRSRPLIEALRGGSDVALVSDSGTPGLSDPGAALVEEALGAGLRVCPVPGPSAVAAAVSVSGFPASAFVFAGFLPSRGAPRRRALTALAAEERPMVIFEAPHRIASTTADLLEALGDRSVTLLREATKIHEEVRRTSLSALAESLRAVPPRGEYTLVVEGRRPGGALREEEAAPPAAESLRAIYEDLLRSGTDRREALREVARRTGLSRSQVYAAVKLAPDREDHRA